MPETAEFRAHLKTAIDALRKAWPCDHITHLHPHAPGNLTKCPGAVVECALGAARVALERHDKKQGVATRD